jgi:hypothetical protein
MLLAWLMFDQRVTVSGLLALTICLVAVALVLVPQARVSEKIMWPS